MNIDLSDMYGRWKEFKDEHEEDINLCIGAVILGTAMGLILGVLFGFFGFHLPK